MPSPEQLNVIVVDDDPAIVEGLTALLTATGHEVEGFTDPEYALERLRRGPRPDIALIDCIMPRLTGAELCDAMRASDVAVPVILMTALADPSFAVHPERGSVLQKPFEVADLLAEVDGITRPRSARARGA
jgi:two-component system response regulator MprA